MYRIASHRVRRNLRELDGSSDPVKAGSTGLWREPINLEWSADVRSGAHNALKSDIAPCPKSAQQRTHAPQQTASSFDHLVGAQ
jgi:hypothetical protein